MRTLLSIAQNQALVKQKRPKNYLQSFQEIKTKKILESLYSETLLIIAQHRILVNKKDRGISINFVSYYCYFLVTSH